jgi:hypothetical protein
MTRIRVLTCAAVAATAVGVLGVTAAVHAAAPRTVVAVSCANTTSDAATLQNAINGSAVGADVRISGTCLLTKGITLLGDRSYTGGDTTGTRLVQDASMSYVLASDAYVNDSTTTGDPLSVSDLTIACDNTGDTNGLVIMSWDVSVTHTEVDSCGGSGIVDTNTNAAGGQISNTSVNSRFDDDFIQNSGAYGFDVFDQGNSVTDGFFDDNQVAVSGKDAVHLDNAAGWNISGNHVYGVKQNAIYTDRMFGSTVADNYVEDFGDGQTSGQWFGIQTGVQGGAGSTISGNKVFNDGGETAGASYVYLAAQADAANAYLSSTGNVVVGDEKSDVGLYYGGGNANLVVASAGNEVTGVGTAEQKDGNVTVSSGI